MRAGTSSKPTAARIANIRRKRRVRFMESSVTSYGEARTELPIGHNGTRDACFRSWRCTMIYTLDLSEEEIAVVRSELTRRVADLERELVRTDKAELQHALARDV